MKHLPPTPDFDCWPVSHRPVKASFCDTALTLTWSDEQESRYHVLLLRENSPDPDTIHPKAREMAIAPTQITADVAIRSATLRADGAIVIGFSDGLKTAFHPGWMRAVAWFGDETPPPPVLWKGSELAEPPTFDGPRALEDPNLFLAWLEALRDYGVARLRGLPQKDGLLEKIVTTIGPIRESNFGRHYVLEIKDEPDSQAYTSDSLLQHIDLPTRETPFGLQFLFTRDNTTLGGEGIYVDAYKIAQDMRTEEPVHYKSLTEDHWEYNNRSRTSDYRGQGPVIETAADGRVVGIRYNTFLRAPLKAPLEIQARAYQAYRAFCARAQDPDYAMRLRYEPGDLLAFDNRRALHGRAGFNANSGNRFIEGIYADRDDLYSRIAILKRQSRMKPPLD